MHAVVHAPVADAPERVIAGTVLIACAELKAVYWVPFMAARGRTRGVPAWWLPRRGLTANAARG
jgi:hypothetical protein